MSKRARTCKHCRRRATSTGLNLLIAASAAPSLEDIAAWASAPATSASGPPAAPRSARQSAIYYGKCAAVARATMPAADKVELDREMRAVKRRALEYASGRFGREITSSTDLNEIEMDIVCEYLDTLLDEISSE
jgi:hypothetical protein